MTINQTTPASSPLDTLKALVHRNINMLEYVTGQIGGGGYDVDEDILEFIDAITDINYNALREHVEIKSEMIGRFNQRRIADAGYTYDDGSPIIEHFEGNGLTSSYYPRYSGNRDLALARHYESVADMNKRFAEECTARAEGREWPPNEEPVDGNAEGHDDPSDG